MDSLLQKMIQFYGDYKGTLFCISLQTFLLLNFSVIDCK